MGIAFAEAKSIITSFYNTFERVSAWKEREIARLMDYGYVDTFLGRERHPILLQGRPRITHRPGTDGYIQDRLAAALWRAEWDHEMRKSRMDPDTVTTQELHGRAQRQAINFEIQGSVAELINAGTLTLYKEGYKIVGQVHDELIVELPDDEKAIQEAADLVESLFNITVKGVPFKVDIAVGRSWACGKE
jgi:DNA polymerase I-like protein with 3'-5' exonuclease and polymerase domains